jgi:hypothetical protein
MIFFSAAPWLHAGAAMLAIHSGFEMPDRCE